MALTQVDQGLLNSYAQYTGFKNRIINGDMLIAQRGTSIAVAANVGSQYTLDRWSCRTITNSVTISQQTPTSPAYYKSLRAQRDSGQAAGYLILEQAFETANIADLRGQYVTVSFVIKGGTTFLANNPSLSITIYCGTGTERVRGNTAYTNETTPLAYGVTVTANETLVTFTSQSVIPTNTTQMEVCFTEYATATAGASEWFEITNFQLEKGATATSFDYRPYGTELQLCQRYLPMFTNSGTGVTAYLGMGTAQSTTNVGIILNLPVPTRVPATGLTITAAASNYRATDQVSSVTTSNVTFSAATPTTVLYELTCTGATQFRPYAGYIMANATEYKLYFTGCEL